MSTLRSNLIRLAHTSPNLRTLLLPILAETRTAAANDPRWINAKFPGVAADGTSFRRGERVLYWPVGKKIMVGAQAEQAWRDFQAQVADEDAYNMRAAASVGSDLEFAADEIERALEILRDVADSLDMRGPGGFEAGGSLADTSADADRVAHGLRTDVSRTLTAYARMLRSR